MMAAPYQATAGPSRMYDPAMPPPPPAKLPSLTPFSPVGTGAPWSNGTADDTHGANSPVMDRDEGTKRNPLVDLIDTERIYVDQLGLVIRVSTLLRSPFLPEVPMSGPIF